MEIYGEKTKTKDIYHTKHENSKGKTKTQVTKDRYQVGTYIIYKNGIIKKIKTNTYMYIICTIYESLF